MRGVFLKIYNKALVLWQNLREIAEDSNNDIALRALLLPVFGVVRIIIRLPFRFLRGVLRYVRGFVRPIIQSPFRFLRGVLRAVRGFVRPIIQAPFRFLGYGLRWARGCMRVFFLFVLPSSFFLSGILSGTAFGTGFPVFDASNVIQSTITAIESVVQTQQQIRQIVQDGENMVKNTTAPAAWLWGTASDSFMDIQRKIDELRHFRDNAGGIDAYLKRYGDVSWYRSSPVLV